MRSCPGKRHLTVGLVASDGSGCVIVVVPAEAALSCARAGDRAPIASIAAPTKKTLSQRSRLAGRLRGLAVRIGVGRSLELGPIMGFPFERRLCLGFAVSRQCCPGDGTSWRPHAPGAVQSVTKIQWSG